MGNSPPVCVSPPRRTRPGPPARGREVFRHWPRGGGSRPKSADRAVTFDTPDSNDLSRTDTLRTAPRAGTLTEPPAVTPPRPALQRGGYPGLRPVRTRRDRHRLTTDRRPPIRGRPRGRGDHHRHDESSCISDVSRMYLDYPCRYMYPACIPHVSCISDTYLSGYI